MADENKHYKPTITLGNILQIITLIFAIAIGWMNFNSRFAVMEQKLLNHDEQIKKIQETNERFVRTQERVTTILELMEKNEH